MRRITLLPRSKRSFSPRLVAITLGLVSWIFLEATYAETDFWPPQLAGLLFSVLGMVVGSLLPQFVRSRAEIIGATPANA